MHRWSTHCDLEHDAPKPAVIRVQVKSNRARQPGRPMERNLSLCKVHAKSLQQLGIDVVDP
jgi:hypothetical protein